MATEFKLSYTANDINDRLGKIDSLETTISEVQASVPTKTSDLTNDAGFITSYTETDPTVPAWAKEATKPTYTADEVGALPADTVIPTVPTDVSAFTNDAGYLTEHQSLEGLATQDYVNTAVANLVDSAPEALNTLDELAAALGDDANFATTVTNQIASKLDSSALPTAINDALAQAKASGEFDGTDGYTPVRGTDYWTEDDKAEIKSYVDEAILGGAW